MQLLQSTKHSLFAMYSSLLPPTSRIVFRALGAFSFYLLGMLTLAVSSPAWSQSLAIDKVLVIVNEEAITFKEYQTRHQRTALQKSNNVEPFAGDIDAQILERMIDERIQAQLATRRGISIPSEKVDRAILSIAQQNDQTLQQLLEYLEKNDITAAQFRASVKEQQLIQQLLEGAVNSRVRISEQEIENYLARHSDLTPDEKYEVSHISILTEGKSDREIKAERENLAFIQESVLKDGSFAKAAQDFSDSPDHDKGGYLGWREVDQLPPLFVQTLRTLKVGGISRILQSQNALHILKLHDKEGSAVVEQQFIRHILIRPDAELSERKAKKLAKKLYNRIVKGEDFESIAKTYSADSISAPQGGQLGWSRPGQFPPEFEKAARALKIDELSKPLRLKLGYHLIQVLDRRATDISGALSARRAEQAIFRRKAEEVYSSWFEPIRESAYIEYISASPPG